MPVSSFTTPPSPFFLAFGFGFLLFYFFCCHLAICVFLKQGSSGLQLRVGWLVCV